MAKVWDSERSRRDMPYNKAINEAITQAMELSTDVVVMGQLVDYQSGIFGTTSGLAEKFGTDRVQDFPVAEGAMTSVAIGAAVAGLRPVLVHQRLDFMMYSLDAIANWLSLWRFKSGGVSGLPVTIRAVVGRGWGQGPQHSKSLHAWFAHLPGIKVAMPATGFDAKGLILESIFGEDPVIVIENRSLFSMTDDVVEAPYRVRFGQGLVRRNGNDLTLVAIGAMVPQALRVASELAHESIQVEVVDPRTISPLDKELIYKSVSKTKRLMVADPGWESAGIGAEIIALVCEEFGNNLTSNPVRFSFPNSHTPMSSALEKEYYPDDSRMAQAIRRMQ